MTKLDEKIMQKAIKHAHQEPDVPISRIASLYGVGAVTLCYRVKGLHVSHAEAHRDEQLFTSGEEDAIAQHCGEMADAGFPISLNLLREITQHILNKRQQPPVGQGGGTIGPREGTTNRDRRTARIKRQGAMIPLSNTTSTSRPEVHVVGAHWVDRFMQRHPDFKKAYIEFQDRVRKAASNDEEAQAYFCQLLGKLLKRRKIQLEDLWNCDEKGIILRRTEIRTVAIVRVGTRPVATTEGSREYSSILETVNSQGRVLPPFIVWQGKTHRESYYRKHNSLNASPRDATFAVSPSGYMDDELGYEYMVQHFEPHTRSVQPRCLIVDGHSSHICYSVVQYVLDHDIHMICLPSKSTHLLQPLDVGCFGLLQRVYERRLQEWLIRNPLSVLSKIEFLEELLFPTRDEIYSIQVITSAWKAARCWPVGSSRAPPKVRAAPPLFTNVSLPTDTPALLCHLAQEVQKDPTNRTLFYTYVDTSMSKLTKYRNIAPIATTLNALRNGKIRKQSSPKRIGAARVLTQKMVNEGIKKNEEAKAQKLEKQQAAAERKRIAEERKIAKKACEEEWKSIKANYIAEVNAWKVECILIEASWSDEREAARAAHKRPPKKPVLPQCPKKPRKPVIVCESEHRRDRNERNRQGNRQENRQGNHKRDHRQGNSGEDCEEVDLSDGQDEVGDDEESREQIDLSLIMRELDIARFAETLN